MNIFFIPSWYPSPDAPLSGIFTQEQVEAISKEYPNIKTGVSLWGQKNEANLIWAQDHLKNIAKLFRFAKEKNSEIRRPENFWEYYSPALTWTHSILQGNIQNVIRANEQNIQRFETANGKVSLIHAHVSFPGGFIAMQLAKKLRLPYIITEQMSPFPLLSYQKNPEILSKIKISVREANAVISLTPHAGNDIWQKTGVKPVCIPNLVNGELFKPAPKTTHASAFTFFTMGRLSPQKGIPDLLKAISITENNDAFYRIAGKGEKETEYRELANKLNISHKIQWLGQLSRTEAVKEFQQCHAFVLPSLHESMGVVYAEAIACGKPVIATRCGGPEFIVNEDNGLLTEVNDPEQLAKAMDYMIENYSRYQKDVIRKDFLERFSSAVITKKIVSVYEAVIANKPLPAELYPDYE